MDCKYSGVRPLRILYSIVNLCLLRLFCRESHPSPDRSFSVLHSFVAPVIILAASMLLLLADFYCRW